MANADKIPEAPETQTDLVRYIEAAGETRNVDAKSPMGWADDNRASLTKDILACANAKNGGVIVIGKKQMPESTFQEVGVSSKEASTFETTKVATWVNNKCLIFTGHYITICIY